MTRVKISICILLFLIGASVFSGVWTYNSCDDMLDSLRSTAERVAVGDIDGAIEKAEEFSADWEDFRKKANAVVKSDKLSEADRIKSRIVHLIESGSDEIEAEISELISMLELLRDGEIPLITSIF